MNGRREVSDSLSRDKSQRVEGEGVIFKHASLQEVSRLKMNRILARYCIIALALGERAEREYGSMH